MVQLWYYHMILCIVWVISYSSLICMILVYDIMHCKSALVFVEPFVLWVISKVSWGNPSASVGCTSTYVGPFGNLGIFLPLMATAPLIQLTCSTKCHLLHAGPESWQDSDTPCLYVICIISNLLNLVSLPGVGFISWKLGSFRLKNKNVHWQLVREKY
jgi:hypothetical protein